MRLLMVGPKSIHTTRQVTWVLECGHTVSLISDENPFCDRKQNFFFYRRPRTWGARYYKKVLPVSLTVKTTEVIRSVGYRRLWKKSDADLVHINWLDNVAYDICMAGLRPFVITVWGTDVNRHVLSNQPESESLQLREVLRCAAAVIVDSSEMIQKCELLAQKRLPAFVIPLGVNTDHFKPASDERVRDLRSKFGIPENAKVIVSIRAFEKRYGHDVILEAFARALRRLKGEAVLVFRFYNPVGRDELESQLRARSDELGISDQVRWFDAVPYRRLPEIYQLADLIVNYPTMDAFPVSFIEAASCECSVVSNKLPAYEGTLAEEFFRLVPPNDVNKLTEAVVDALSNDDRRANLTAARERVRTQFDERFSKAQLIEVYRQAVTGSTNN